MSLASGTSQKPLKPESGPTAKVDPAEAETQLEPKSLDLDFNVAAQAGHTYISSNGPKP